MNPTTQAAFIPELWASLGLRKLGNYVTFTKLASRDWQNEFAQLGQTINIRKPRSYTVRKLGIATGGTVTQENPTASTVAVTLDQHAYVQVQPTDVVRALLSQEALASIVGEVMIDIASQIDADAVTECANFTGTDTGTQGTAITTIAPIVEARRSLVINKMPKNDVAALILGPVSESDVLKQSLFHQANTSGTEETLRNGRLGRAFGFDTYVDQNIDDTALVATAGEKNIYFHRSGLVVATRPIPLPESVPSAIVSNPEDDMGIRVTKQWVEASLGESVTFDTLYGWKVVEPTMGGYVLGETI